MRMRIIDDLLVDNIVWDTCQQLTNVFIIFTAPVQISQTFPRGNGQICYQIRCKGSHYITIRLSRLKLAKMITSKRNAVENGLQIKYENLINHDKHQSYKNINYYRWDEKGRIRVLVWQSGP